MEVQLSDGVFLSVETGQRWRRQDEREAWTVISVQRDRGIVWVAGPGNGRASRTVSFNRFAAEWVPA